MSTTFYVSTAIYYANGKLHIGHCYEAVAADAIARYRRAKGDQVHFLTGTDEHGNKILRRAREHGLLPQEYVDAIAASVLKLQEDLGISYDDFIRTTEERHRQPVQAIFRRLQEQGDIYLDEYEGWYCESDEAFVPQGRVGPDHLCPECGGRVAWTQETAWKFRLSRYAPQIEELLAQPGFLVPESRRNEQLAFVRQGLEDLAVSRANLPWGIPVPGDAEQTIYVWIDALSNYITALGYGSEEDGLFRHFWPADLHVVGKDIARFHVVIWPALLLALGLPLPKQVFAHGWFNQNGQKLAKSTGNTVDPHPLLERYGLDAVRYYLLRELPFGPDANYSEEALIRRTNVDLANDLGNLLSRTTQLINKFAGGQIPDPSEGSDGVLAAAASQALVQLEESLADLRLADGLAALWGLVGRANKYVDETAPWALAKDPAQAGRLAAVLYDLSESLRVTAAALVPFLVTTPERIYEQLGLEPGLVRSEPWDEVTRWGGLQPGRPIRRGAPLFPRLG